MGAIHRIVTRGGTLEQGGSDVTLMFPDGIDEQAAAALVEAFAAAQPGYKTFCKSMKDLLQKLCKGEEIQVMVEARVKEVSHLAEKLKRKRGYATLREIPDLVGVRLIVLYLSEVDKVVQLISSEFSVAESSPHEFESPDTFGYRGHHLVVSLSESRAGLGEWAGVGDLCCEVQIRTILQHAWASISHSLDYKSETDIPSKLRHDLFKVAAVLECADDSFDQYRASVVRLRESYAVEDDWRSLPIDVYSLLTHWSKLPEERLKSAIESVGKEFWPPGRTVDDAYTAVVRGAAMARLQTLGMLEDYILKTDIADKLRLFIDISNSAENISGMTPVTALLAAFLVVDGEKSADSEYILGITRSVADRMS